MAEDRYLNKVKSQVLYRVNLARKEYGFAEIDMLPHGIPNSGTENPIARALPEVRSVELGRIYTRLSVSEMVNYARATYASRIVVDILEGDAYIKLDGTTIRFLELFDQGWYPELVEREEE